MFPTTEDAAINARLDPKILHAMTRGDVRDSRMMRDHAELRDKSGFTPSERMRSFEPRS